MRFVADAISGDATDSAQARYPVEIKLTHYAIFSRLTVLSLVAVRFQRARLRFQ